MLEQKSELNTAEGALQSTERSLSLIIEERCGDITGG